MCFALVAANWLEMQCKPEIDLRYKRMNKQWEKSATIPVAAEVVKEIMLISYVQM